MKAVFVGSFNPFHLGHLDIISQLWNIFGKENVLVYAAINAAKFKDMSETEIEKVLLKNRELLDEVEVKIKHKISSLGYKSTATLMRELDEEYGNAILIRGLRDGIDYQYEEKSVTYLRKLYPQLKVMYLPSSDKFRHISSSDIRNMLASNMPDLIKMANDLKI